MVSKKKLKVYALLHFLLLIMGLSGVLSKFASRQAFLSIPFLILYGSMLALLAIYALGWQQVLKRLPLTVAYANRGCSLVYSLVFGALFFQEKISWNKLVGCGLAIVGVLLYVSGNTGDKQQ